MIERHSFNPALAESLHTHLVTEGERLFGLMAGIGIEMNESRRVLEAYKVEENRYEVTK